MSMEKVIPPDAWGPSHAPQLQLVKASAHAGLGGADLRDFVKRAGHALADWVRQHPPLPGETLVHALAMGSTETVGPNRNSDGYKNDMLKRDHPSFEKYARWFMNHANGNPAQSYGVIRKAYYNPELQRVEVIAALNGTKAAAAHNGGLVAEYTLNRLERDLPIAVSMATKIPYDQCVACGNKARTRAEYCGPEKCAKYGGCRDNLGQVFDDGFHLYVDNPHCTFHDLSDVSMTRGADRTAFVTGKVSAARHPLGGAALAEQLGLVVPEYVLEPRVLAALKTARRLEEWERRPDTGGLASYAAYLGCRGAALPALPGKAAGADDRQRWVGDLAAAGLLLPPAWWLAAYSGVAPEKCARFLGHTPLSARELLESPLRADLLRDHALPPAAAPEKYAAHRPTRAACERVAWAAARHPGKAAHAPADVAPEHAAAARRRYLAYAANVLAAHAGTPNEPLILAEALHHNRHQPW